MKGSHFNLSLAGRTVEYGPQNAPITARVLSKRYNKYYDEPYLALIACFLFHLQPGDEAKKETEEDSPPIKLLSSRVVIIHPLTGCR